VPRAIFAQRPHTSFLRRKVASPLIGEIVEGRIAGDVGVSKAELAILAGSNLARLTTPKEFYMARKRVVALRITLSQDEVLSRFLSQH
jgi:hypothetical protein